MIDVWTVKLWRVVCSRVEVGTVTCMFQGWSAKVRYFSLDELYILRFYAGTVEVCMFQGWHWNHSLRVVCSKVNVWALKDYICQGFMFEPWWYVLRLKLESWIVCSLFWGWCWNREFQGFLCCSHEGCSKVNVWAVSVAKRMYVLRLLLVPRIVCQCWNCEELYVLRLMLKLCSQLF